MDILLRIKKLFFKKPKIMVVLGQTSTGKSDLAVEIARKYNGEIISADSRQVYRGMDLGSGKITTKEMRGIPHYLLDVADPKDIFDVQKFQKLGTEAIQDILKRKKIPIICGGTGFYIDSLVYQTEFSPVKPNLTLRKELEKKSLAELQELFNKKIMQNKQVKQPRSLVNYFQNLLCSLRKYTFWDDKSGQQIDIKNPVRIIRALEIIEELGSIPKTKKNNPYNILFIGLKLPKEDLDKRIHTRILKRLGQGMLDEAHKLLKQGVNHKRLQYLGLEYRFMSKYILGEISKDEMIEQLYRATVQFAKRQKTWFKRNKKIHWFDSLGDKNPLYKLIDNFLK